MLVTLTSTPKQTYEKKSRLPFILHKITPFFVMIILRKQNTNYFIENRYKATIENDDTLL